MENNYCIIMAGGVGSRFWPMSTPQKPKQFLDMLGLGKSLLQLTFERLKLIAPADQIYIVTNVHYADLVHEQIPEIDRGQILTEPQRKNTAPCIAYAASKIYDLNPNAVLTIAPSDHLITNEQRFTHIINTAIDQAKKDRLVTLGIKPTRPDTGYGYIEFEAGAANGGDVKEVKQFREKPNLELAEEFVQAGNFFWNSGIFIWKAGTILEALKQFVPKLHELFDPAQGFYNGPKEQEGVDHGFETCEDISIDYAVMENAKNVDVVLADFDWSDLGTWGSLYGHMKLDNSGNAVVGDHVYMKNSSNCIVNLPANKLALIEGLDDHIVVESDGMLMILSKKDEQNLKKHLPDMHEHSSEFFK
ncbi:MAG: mannose-1-phosphate guanylyltransferase [Bacteroidetes bacterium]|nr:MAG: mannose-1-phosphate guanylyltransferase [Bacteroidota bacterium]